MTRSSGPPEGGHYRYVLPVVSGFQLGTITGDDLNRPRPESRAIGGDGTCRTRHRHGAWASPRPACRDRLRPLAPLSRRCRPGPAGVLPAIGHRDRRGAAVADERRHRRRARARLARPAGRRRAASGPAPSRRRGRRRHAVDVAADRRRSAGPTRSPRLGDEGYVIRSAHVGGHAGDGDRVAAARPARSTARSTSCA